MYSFRLISRVRPAWLHNWIRDANISEGLLVQILDTKDVQLVGFYELHQMIGFVAFTNHAFVTRVLLVAKGARSKHKGIANTMLQYPGMGRLIIMDDIFDNAALFASLQMDEVCCTTWRYRFNAFSSTSPFFACELPCVDLPEPLAEEDRADGP